MFDLGWTELLVIAVVAIVVVGPKDLPRVMRSVGGTVTKMRRMARDFQRQINDAIRDEELDKLQKDVTALGKDMERDVRRGVETSDAEIKRGLAVPSGKPGPAKIVGAGKKAQGSPPAQLSAPTSETAAANRDAPADAEPGEGPPGGPAAAVPANDRVAAAGGTK